MDYKTSGVNIDAGNRAVDLIKDKVKSTFSPQVLGGLGGFAGAFELPTGYTNPVLISCTDGVGTKLRIALDNNVLDTVGIDLVAMCVNDMICCGAKPLYFLDYIACHALIPEQMDALVTGMVNGCEFSDCSLIGGEMAEMNDMYKPGDVDLAGFSVGVVEKSEIIDGKKVKAGDFVYGLPSSGVHSNGYSLLRKVLTPEVCKREGISAETMLEPTRIYVKEVLELIEKYDIHALAHITGGGLFENVERVLPDAVTLSIDWDTIDTPEIFSQIQRIGQIETSEMRRVFNMGVGMVIVSPDRIPSLNQIGLIS